MDPRTIPGFLGTAASRASDINLIAYVLLIVPGMLIGFMLARRKIYAYHQMMMSTIVIVNWFLLGYIMLTSYAHIAPDVPTHLNQPVYTLPTVHLLFGGTAQILGTILALQMFLGPIMPFRLGPIKVWMRLTLSLWLITAALGVMTYLTFYGVPFSPQAKPATISGTPVATQEVTDGTPVATQEATPLATQEVTTTPAVTQSR